MKNKKVRWALGGLSSSLFTTNWLFYYLTKDLVIEIMVNISNIFLRNLIIFSSFYLVTITLTFLNAMILSVTTPPRKEHVTLYIFFSFLTPIAFLIFHLASKISFGFPIDFFLKTIPILMLIMPVTSILGVLFGTTLKKASSRESVDEFLDS